MFTFNVYSGLLLIGFTQATVVATLLLWRSRREERISDVFAAGILLAGALYVAQWMLGFGGWYDSRDWRTTLMFYVEWGNLAALGPLVYLYFLSVTNTDFRWRRAHWWHFLPAGIFLLLPTLILLYDWGYHRLLRGRAFECFFGTRGPLSEWRNQYGVPFDIAEDIFVRLQLVIYLFLTVLAYREYRRYLSAEFSNPEPLELRGVRRLLFLLLGGIVATVAVEAYGCLAGGTSYADAWPRYFSMSVLLFFAALQFFAIDPHLTRSLRFGREEGTLSPTEASLPDPETKRWAGLLERRLAEHHDYLDPGLRLGELAARVGTNASVLSRTINGAFGMNFNDYLNGLRCAAFLDRVRREEHRRHTLLSLALDCGFNSKSTFNRAFRKYAGKSPVEAVRELDANNDMGRPKP